MSSKTVAKLGQIEKKYIYSGRDGKTIGQYCSNTRQLCKVFAKETVI